MCTFNHHYHRDRSAYVSAKEWSEKLSDQEIDEIYKLISVSNEKTSTDDKREALKYMKYNKILTENLGKAFHGKVPDRDLEFEKLQEHYARKKED